MADQVESWKARARACVAQAGASGRGGVGIRVRITPGFVVLGAAVGIRYGSTGPLVVLAVLVSVMLASELPGALMAGGLGRSAEVELSALGPRTRLSGARLAGAAGVAFFLSGIVLNVLVAVGCARGLRGASASAARIFALFAVSHASWAVAQLVPLVPFRAGRALAARLAPSARFLHAALSTAFVLTVALIATRAPLLFPLATLTALASAGVARDALSAHADEQSGARAFCEQAENALRAGHALAASELAERGLARTSTPDLRSRLWETLAWSAIGQHDALLAHSALSALPARALDAYLVAAYLSCCNRIDEAVALLSEFRESGQRDRETTKLLIDLLFRRGDSRAALELAYFDKGLLSSEDWRAIRAVAHASGALAVEP